MSKGRKPARQPLTLQDHLQRIRDQFPNIRPFREQNDLYWRDEGMDALKSGHLSNAEQIFKKLIVAQPDHFDGYYGLSLAYKLQHQIHRATLFADESLRLAQAFIDDGSLDPSTFETMRLHRQSLTPPA